MQITACKYCWHGRFMFWYWFTSNSNRDIYVHFFFIGISFHLSLPLLLAMLLLLPYTVIWLPCWNCISWWQKIQEQRQVSFWSLSCQVANIFKSFTQRKNRNTFCKKKHKWLLVKVLPSPIGSNPCNKPCHYHKSLLFLLLLLFLPLLQKASYHEDVAMYESVALSLLISPKVMPSFCPSNSRTRRAALPRPSRESQTPLVQEKERRRRRRRSKKRLKLPFLLQPLCHRALICSCLQINILQHGAHRHLWKSCARYTETFAIVYKILYFCVVHVVSNSTCQCWWLCSWYVLHVALLKANCVQKNCYLIFFDNHTLKMVMGNESHHQTGGKQHGA